MNYPKYRFKDFMLDEKFQQWVLEPESDTNLFWNNWLQTHPEKQADIARAKAAIIELHLAGIRKEQAFSKKKSEFVRAPTAEEKHATWENIAKTIKAPAITNFTENEAAKDTKIIPVFFYSSWARVAASIIFILAVGAVFLLKQKPAGKVEEITYATSFGEKRMFTLPDNSTIFLNGNSRLTTAKEWSSESDREVKLEGEGFFSVVHTQNHKKFKVLLPGGAQVEVLGTEFTVTERPTVSRVVLNKGKVKVAIETGQNEMSAGKPPVATIMAPGDLVEIDRLQGQLTKTKILNPEYYAGFTENIIEFKNSPLSEVARVLQDNYGYKVTFIPASLAKKRFTSSNPDNRIDLLLFAIEKSFNLKVVQKDKKITFQAK